MLLIESGNGSKGMVSKDSEEEMSIRVKEVDRVPPCSVSNAFSLGMSFCYCNFHLLRTIPFSIEVIEFSPLSVFKAGARGPIGLPVDWLFDRSVSE